jgi:hypothetical protein
VTGTVCDPVFLGSCSRGLDCELLSSLVEDGSCLHLRGVVTIAEFCETEAAHIAQGINLIHEGQMSISV